MFFKKIMIATMASVVLIGALPVEAATFGKSSSSSTSSTSRSSSFGSSSTSRSSSFAATPSRSSTTTSGSSTSGGISQGTSLGMSRSNVANNVKNGTYTAPANGTTVAGSNPGGANYNRGTGSYNTNNGNYNNGNYGNGNYNNGSGYGYGQSQGHSTGALVGAAAVAGVAGYALGAHNNNGNTVIVPGANGYNNGNGNYVNGNGNGNPAMDSNGNYVTAPVGMAPVQAVSSGGGFGSFLWAAIKIILGLIVLYILARVIMSFFNNRGTSNFAPVAGAAPIFSSKTPEDQLRDMKEDFFVQFQQNNRPSGLDQIRQSSTPVFYNAVEDMVRGQSETRTVKVRQLEAEVVDVVEEGSRYIASVRYHAVVAEGDNGSTQDSEVKELWNFVYENNRWKLAGVDQL